MIPLMLNGTYNPGQLRSSARSGTATSADFDTAVFTGNMADYAIFDFGSYVQVADQVGTDGTDTLKHVERLQFADQAVVLSGLNHAPAGTLSISNTAPVENHPVTVSIAGVTDADNVSSTNPTELSGHPSPISGRKN